MHIEEYFNIVVKEPLKNVLGLQALCWVYEKRKASDLRVL